MGLVRPTPAVSARRMATNCPSGARNPHRLADDIHGIGFLTADSLRLMLGIAPTSTFRLHAALEYVLAVVARTESG